MPGIYREQGLVDAKRGVGECHGRRKAPKRALKVRELQ